MTCYVCLWLIDPGNAILDFESAPIPSSTIPNHGIEPATKKDEKDEMAVTRPHGHQSEDVTVSAADQYLSPNDNEIEPTEEEYATLPK